jgi:hypothetical protein
LKTLFLLFFTSFILPLLVNINPGGSPIITTMPTPLPELIYIQDVPFVSQAPFGDWKDQRQQDGCEEAASLIAVYWAKGEKLTKPQALEEILAIASYETGKYGSYVDTSAFDTNVRIIKGYFNFPNAKVVSLVSIADLIAPLGQNQLVIVPTNGRLLNNPNYTLPGPERHNLVIRGYDLLTHEFITNDPGTRKGENYRYPEKVLFNAIRDYPTGDHLPILIASKSAILVSKTPGFR